MEIIEPHIFLNRAVVGQYVPVPVVMTWFIMAIIMITVYLATRKLEQIPGTLQNFIEAVYELLTNFVVTMMGPKGCDFVPLIGSFFIFILCSNLLGLIPGFESPTSHLDTTVALALVAFFAVQYYGIKANGLFGYLKHFAGEPIWLAPLNIPIHIIGELARPLSLSIRLFGNIRGEDITLCILLWLMPFLIPLPMMVLVIFTSLIQAMVFTMLSMAYIGGVLSHGEHKHH